jgi:glucosyl-3-phosphoglycerate phosphatase
VRVILVRHGLSEWNAEGRLQGVSDPPLADRGREQARALAPLVAALRPEVSVSSDLRRARETLELLSTVAPAGPGDPAWREADLGLWAGRLPSELSPDEHAGFLAWRAGRAGPPGGEPWGATRDRVVDAVRALAATGARRALVVTHGGPVRALCHALVGLDPTSLVPVANASVTVLETHPLPHLLAFGVAPPE